MYPDDFLEDCPPGNLRCGCCSKSVSTKASCVKSHITSATDCNSKSAKERKAIRSESVRDYLITESLKEKRVSGDTLHMDQRLGRFNISRVVMMSGISFSKLRDPISGLKEALEVSAGAFHDRALTDLIPEHSRIERELLKSELKGVQGIGIIFYGTTAVCEV